MDLGIAGRKALICGGSRGMGRAAALELSKAGAQVTIVARDKERLARAASEIGSESGSSVAWVSADLTASEGRAAVLSACPEPDILLNNTEGPRPGDFREWDRETWIAVIDSVMLTPIEMIRLTVDGMMKRKFGRIVNITSRTVKKPQLELGLSGGARSGLTGFVAGLSRQTIVHNVTINNILPGIFDTEAQRNHIVKMIENTGETFEAVWERRARQNPAGRYGKSEEFGALCAFICSDRAGFMTGQNFLIDGGDYCGVL